MSPLPAAIDRSGFFRFTPQISDFPMKNKPNIPFVPKSTSAPRSSSEEQLSALVKAYRSFGLSERDAQRVARADFKARVIGLALAA